jgi:hypothetical protein
VTLAGAKANGTSGDTSEFIVLVELASSSHGVGGRELKPQTNTLLQR